MSQYPTYPMHTCKCQALASGQIVFCPLHAAAPELLALLRIYVAAFSADHITPHSGNDCFHCDARAAIAKAKGDKA